MAQSDKPLPVHVEQIRLLRMQAQRLSPLSPARISVAEMVKGIFCVQAQDTKAVPLAIRARSSDITAKDVEHAWAIDRSVVRTWLMRGTLHLVAAEDLNWLLALFGPTFAPAGTGRRAQLGLDAAVSKLGVTVVRNALAGRGPLTKAEIAEQLSAHDLPSTGQAPIHIIGLAALEGYVCAGPDRGGKATYVLLEEWIAPGKTMPRAEALVELVKRYLAAYGPATPEDCAAWSGLRINEIREAWQQLEDDIVPLVLQPQLFIEPSQSTLVV